MSIIENLKLDQQTMLVNPANRKLKHAGGIAAALAKRIGPSTE